MSATGRSDVREALDHYVTPDWSIRRFLEAYTLPQGATVLDPCAANGELLTEIHRLRPDLRLFAIELRDTSAELARLRDAGVIVGYQIGDFLAIAAAESDVPPGFDYVITNPPYALAEEFIRGSTKIAKVSAFLLRLNFLGAKKRNAFLRFARPGLFVSSDRPSFTGTGTDSTEYAWQVFGDPSVAGTWRLLPLTDKVELAKCAKRARDISSR
jgi:hypothetical protein